MAYELHIYQGVRLIEDGKTVFELGNLFEPVKKTTGAVIHHQRYTLTPGQNKTIFTKDTVGRFQVLLVKSDGFAYLEYVCDKDTGGAETRSSLPLCAGVYQAVWADDVLTSTSATGHAANTFAGEAGFIDDARAFNPATATANVTIDVYAIADAS